MKDAEQKGKKASTSETDATPEAEPKLSPTDQLAANLAVLEKAVSMKETRMISGRLLRQTAAIRHQLTPQILSDFVTKALPEDATMGPILLKQLKQVQSLPLEPELGSKPCTLICTLWHRLPRVQWTHRTLPKRLAARQQLPRATFLRLRLMPPCLSLSILLTTSCAQRHVLLTPWIGSEQCFGCKSDHCCCSHHRQRK